MNNINDNYKNVIELFKSNLKQSIEVKLKITNDLNFQNELVNVCTTIIQCLKNDGTIYIAGNGGSAADAQHLATEFISKLSRDREPLAAEALTTDSSIITAIGNDYGFNKIFSRQLEAKITNNDVFIGISTSGNSENIINALKVCQDLAVPSILLGGNKGGKALKYAKMSLVIPSEITSIIQECHISTYHTICEHVENEICFSD